MVLPLLTRVPTMEDKGCCARNCKKSWICSLLHRHERQGGCDGWRLKSWRCSSIRLSSFFLDDREVVMTAVQNFGCAIEYADESLRKDGEIVIASVLCCGCALQFVDPLFKANSEIVLTAVRNDGLSLEFAHPSLRADRNIVLEAVRRHGDALGYADSILASDREIVMEAVRNNGLSIRYASGLTSDKKIAMEALSNDADAFMYLDDALKSDREFVLHAMRHNISLFSHAEETVRQDPAILLYVHHTLKQYDSVRTGIADMREQNLQDLELQVLDILQNDPSSPLDIVAASSRILRERLRREVLLGRENLQSFENDFF